MSQKAAVQVEVRVFDSKYNRDNNGLGSVPGDELFANPEDYGVKKIVVVWSFFDLNSATDRVPAENCAFVKLAATRGGDPEKDEYSDNLFHAMSWLLANV